MFIGRSRSLIFKNYSPKFYLDTQNKKFLSLGVFSTRYVLRMLHFLNLEERSSTL